MILRFLGINVLGLKSFKGSSFLRYLSSFQGAWESRFKDFKDTLRM
jgi:hypothetical protein